MATVGESGVNGRDMSRPLSEEGNTIFHITASKGVSVWGLVVYIVLTMGIR